MNLPERSQDKILILFNEINIEKNTLFLLNKLNKSNFMLSLQIHRSEKKSFIVQIIL